MFVRVATFEGVDIQAAKKTSSAARSTLTPLYETMPGWQGTMDVADASTGKVFSFTFFNSEENAKAAEPVFDEDMPRILGKLMDGWTGKRVSVDTCEVIFQHPQP